MSEADGNKNLTDRLIEQDVGISQSQLKEFRMNLELSLKTLEDNAEWSHRNTVRAVIWMMIFYACGFVLNMINHGPGIGLSPAIAIIWMLGTWIATITAGILVIRHWSIHAPALQRGRTDLQIALFNELQQEVSELNDKIDQSIKK